MTIVRRVDFNNAVRDPNQFSGVSLEGIGSQPYRGPLKIKIKSRAPSSLMDEFTQTPRIPTLSKLQ